ncbi:lysozyme murein hydrolase [Aeromonas phage 44RR2.8t]|uniref:Lysozyme n=2 Tax=Biquartavirus 44RR2 TaxID=115987 RepID=Q6U979_9CAUD|nr:e [Aeromonas phage 44RR2.8t] [Aeromonas phage 44RR2.8t]AAQ81541.1 lysozyme murein hydrolase [Aeromonas phage 44RR2.8t]APU00695.1 baseplate hub protein [Aeromonas phage 44RR2.8t.2]
MTLEDMLVYDEGRKLKVYWDHLGYPTVGIGHLIVLRETKDMGVINHMLGEQLGHRVDGVISDEDCSKLFESDVKSVKREIGRYPAIKSAFDACDETRQKAIYNMMFQMGGPRLSGFKKSLGLIAARNWTAAYAELLNSSWARQTPNRAQRVAQVILTGTMDAYR